MGAHIETRAGPLSKPPASRRFARTTVATMAELLSRSLAVLDVAVLIIVASRWLLIRHQAEAEA